MTIINLLMITVIVVFIIDLSGIVDSIKHLIWRIIVGNKREYRNFNLKPIDCSLCMTFWTGLIYLMTIGQFTLVNIMLVCLFSFLTPVIKDVMITLSDILTWIIQKINIG